MALILDGNGLIQGLSAGGLPDGSIDADSLASTLDLSSKTMTFGNVTASGITFPASISASGNPNTLDDYEEGTWTPTVTFGGNSAAQVYVQQAGSYTKIGNNVTIRCFVQFSNKGSSTGDAVIIGLPFSIPNVTNAHTANALAMHTVSFADYPEAWAQPNTSSVLLYEITNAGTQTTLTNANFANDSWVMVSCSYRI